VPRIILKGPAGHVEHTLEITPGGSVVVGRVPSADAGLQGLGNTAFNVELVRVLSASVSANHLVLWNEQGKTYLRDLGSRNGTWVRLPRDETLGLESEEIVVHLAQNAKAATGGDEPETPSWNDRSDFAAALGASVRAWFHLQGIDVAATVLSAIDRGAAETCMPLATGEVLRVTPLVTADASWSQLVERVFRWIARQNRLYEAEQQTRDEGLILASPAIRIAHRDVVEAAQVGARTLVLTGPSGAGKEMLAQVFHRHSGRAGPFVALNTSMFNRELLRSELFGAEAGSFTGATKRIVGAVERAEGGTLLLDEIGDLPSDVQPMLLRFLDSREFQRLGRYGQLQRADVCVIAATNRDLREAARAGTFRHDLWYRLSVHVVEVPPLRSRWEDVAAFLRSKPLNGGAHSLLEAFTSEALEVLRAHLWEGNFRELANFTQRLPRDATLAGIDAKTCRSALERGSIRPITKEAAPVAASNERSEWSDWVRRAMDAFVEDHGSAPSSWDDQKEWSEKYLKPLLFYHLSGAASFPPPTDDEALASLASRAATHVRADRGTAIKQLTRYYERFRQ
jgi:DNA-binding NtrC family response regulator